MSRVHSSNHLIQLQQNIFVKIFWFSYPTSKINERFTFGTINFTIETYPSFSMVVFDIPKCWCFVHSYNARPKKRKLFLQSSNVNHLGKDSISWKWWIFLGGCRYSSQWKPMPRLEFFTPASTSYKRFSYCWIFLFVVKRFFLLWTWLFSYSHGASYHPVATPKLLTFIL